MDWVIASGVLSLGVAIGWMGYVVFTKESNLKALTVIVGVFGGAVVAGNLSGYRGHQGGPTTRGMVLPRRPISRHRFRLWE